MKLAYWLTPFALIASVGATPALALPTEPDYSCYVINPCGEAIDLTPICSGSPKVKTASNASNSRSGSPRRNSGSVPQVGMQVYLSNGVWITNGKIQNRTREPISNLQVTLQVVDRTGATQVQTASVEQVSLRPGEVGSFQTGISYASVRQIEGQPLVVPTVSVAAVQWTNPDGSAGRYP